MDPNRTLQDLIPEFEARGDLPAILAVEEGRVRVWSYGELVGTARRLAAGLAARGVAAGEPVVLLSPNRPEWVVARLALIDAGALAVPLDDLITDGELGRALADSGSRRVFTTREYVQRLEALETSDGLELILLDGEGSGADGTLYLRALLAESCGPLHRSSPDDPTTLFYTSGTTGPPKGVPLSHRNILSNMTIIGQLGFLGPGDRVLLPLPLHHSYPFLIGMLLPFMSGATMVLPAGIAGPEIVAALRAGEVTAMVGVPRLYEALVTEIETRVSARGRVAATIFHSLLALSVGARRRFGLRVGRTLFGRLHRELAPNLNLLGCGGAPLDPEIEGKLEALGWEVVNGYGLTETTSISTFNPRGQAKIGSVGRPVQGVEVRIADPDQDGRGEVLIRGPHVFAGYRNNPDANREAFAADGWFRTGDLGYLDADGYLYIVGRVKELIVLADGKNISPENIEAHYAESPLIGEIAVLEEGGDLVALVGPDLDAMRTASSGRIEDTVRITLADRSAELPTFQRISGYAIVREALPRTRLGKYRRHELPAIYARTRAGARRAPGRAAAAWQSEVDRTLMANPRARQLWEWLAARFPEEPLSLDTAPQLDLGIDSLAWVNLSLEIERDVGIRLTEDTLAQVLTLRDLMRETTEAPALGDVAEDQALTDEQLRWISPPGPLAVAFGIFIYLIDFVLIRGLFRLRVKGGAHVARAGHCVIVPNHVSDLDPFVLVAAFSWRRLQAMRWGGDVTRMFHTPFRRFVARAMRVFPVDDRAGYSSIALAKAILNQGENVVWFPEGWRSPDGRLQPFMRGVGLLLEGFDGNVLPARVEGTFEALPRGRRLPHLRPLTITFGSPVSVPELEAAGQGADRHERIADGLWQALAGLETAGR